MRVDENTDLLQANYSRTLGSRSCAGPAVHDYAERTAPAPAEDTKGSSFTPFEKEQASLAGDQTGTFPVLARLMLLVALANDELQPSKTCGKIF